MLAEGKILQSSKKGIGWALWLYGFMALWLYGFMALQGRLKHIFIVSKLRLSENFPRKQNSFLQKYSVAINYISINASGNSLRAGWYSNYPKLPLQFLW